MLINRKYLASLVSSRKVPAVTILVVLLLLSGAGFILFWHFKAAQSLNSVAHWQERIELLGATAAYEELDAQLEGRIQTEQHTAAHVFGEALWNEAGLKGFVACDRRFVYGCAHQFIALAITEKGLGVIKEISKLCTTCDHYQRVAFLHAVGHGTLGFLGYLNGGLQKTIALCDEHFGTMSHYCYIGTFMEFNYQRLESGGQLKPREQGTNPLTPCEEFEDLPARMCVLTLPNWWRSLMVEEGITEAEIAVAKIRDRCASITPKNLSDICYAGIAFAVAFNFDDSPEIKARLCEIGTPGPQEALLCKRYLHMFVSAYYRSLKNTSYRAETVCEGLDAAARQECTAAAHLTEL